MTTFEEMVAAYPKGQGVSVENAEYEVMQQIILAGLHRGGFFKYAAFYGGTCLRIFHNLPRFSEDMDFSLTGKYTNVHIEDFFPAIIEEFHITGHDVTIVKKDKKTFGRVESAFLKENTEAFDIKFQTKRTIKIKIELDTDPPLGFETEQKMLLKPYSFMTQCYTLPYLFAGKMHALVYRAWGNRIKGRDWYDFEWYVRYSVPLNFAHLQQRIKEFSGVTIDKETFITQLKEKLRSTDIGLVKRDVERYVFNPQELEIWSNDYFLQLADMIKWC